jgi:light-regulated signal transduction histidine kinase (bacteriophytochrome)
MLGFDRVMVYQFRDDGSGEVIAEARDAGIDSFMGLRYPATDIPRQARELYKKNLFRIISEVQSEPVPIEPPLSMHGQPLDLSMSTLRAVSPIHLEYLRNMGIDASLSISIVQDGELWGLFACHHYSPRVLPFALRTVAELFAEFYSARLQTVIDRSRREVVARARDLHNRLMSRLAGGSDLVGSLPAVDAIISEAVPHDGSSAYIEGVYRSRGHAPNEEEFLAIVPALNSASASKVFASNKLAARAPKAEAFADRAVGALVIPVSRRPRDYIVLWRREVTQTVTWAGNPEKPVELGKNGARLTPRKSFEAWRESVSGMSETWSEDEMQTAESLRVSLLEVVLKLTDDAMRERARAQEQQELLIAELNHRVRNILNLIRGVVSQTSRDPENPERYAQRITGRIDALAMAHDNITRQNWQPASLKSLIRAESSAYLDDKAGRVRVNGPDALVKPEAYTVLALVLHEMITNSAKYGSLCDSSGTLSLTIARTRMGELEIYWKESGGPPVRAPERRGFGTTIVEKSIPYELKGEAEVQYKLSGVEARFLIPASCVEFLSEEEAEEVMAEAKNAENRLEKPEQGLPQNVLLVEDSMIIAMDTEDALIGLGVANVRIAGQVSSALDEIEKDAPDFALLDYNLGAESSDAVAQALKERAIPFYFATGYGEGLKDAAEKGASGILQKPYSNEDLNEALQSANR